MPSTQFHEQSRFPIAPAFDVYVDANNQLDIQDLQCRNIFGIDVVALNYSRGSSSTYAFFSSYYGDEYSSCMNTVMLET